MTATEEMSSDSENGVRNPLFSVVVCTYNRAHLLPGAINAILGQNFDDFELIIVDDGSADETADVVANMSDSRIRYIHRDNGGLSAARNTGIEASTGELIIFIDDDDRADEIWLRELASALQAAPNPANVGVISCGCRYVEDDGRFRKERMPVERPKAFNRTPTPVLMLAGCFAVRREIYRAIGGYEQSIPTTHQTELALRLLPFCESESLAVLNIQQPLVSIEWRPISERPLNQPEDLLQSVEYVLDVHKDRLKLSPRFRGSYRAVAGVAAAQSRDMPRARRHLLHAVISFPSPRNLGRLAMSLLPGASRRWRRHWRDDG